MIVTNHCSSASALSCVIGETVPRPSFNQKCPADAVADNKFEENYQKEKKNKIFDSISNCDCIRQASHEICELQIKDIDLLPYFQYLEEGKLPENERDARRIVLESEKMEVIDGVLRHDSAADRLQWCVAVPKELRQDLISETHASLFSGHLSERKVYDRLRRRF